MKLVLAALSSTLFLGLAGCNASSESHSMEASGLRGTGQSAERSRILIVTGRNNHDWKWTSPYMRRVLEASGKFEVDLAPQPGEFMANAERLSTYDAILLDYNGPRWGEPAESNFLAAVRGGTGVIVVHAGNNPFDGWQEYEDLVGYLWRKGTGHGKYHAFDVKVNDRDHPVTRDLADITNHPDELYHRLAKRGRLDYRILATAYSDPATGGTGEHEPMVIVSSFGAGRVFHTPLGHVWENNVPSRASHLDPQFHDLLVRGSEWAATGAVTPTQKVAPNSLTAADRAAGWRLLFDGESTDGWRGFKRESFPEKGWVIEDGCIKVLSGGGGGDIITTDTFGDFEFELEWRVAEGANSGIMYRVTEDDGAVWMTGPEYQILDDDKHRDGKNPMTSAGSLYGMIAGTDRILVPVGEWNHARIVIEGGRLEHWLNGVQILSTRMDDPGWEKMIAGSKFKDFPRFGRMPRGHISLQDHGDDVWYRNIKIREPRVIEAAAPRGAAIDLFDGRSLKGWEAFLKDGGRMEDVWSVEDGVLVCKGRPIGYLKTEAEYTNYVLELDWRFDPVTKKAGNSGVLLRMQGPDKVWPKSVEAQLQSGNAGDFWNIDKFEMQTVAERTSGRNTKKTHANENPIGEWNHYEIRVDHGTIVLSVNGQELNRATQVAEVPGRICLQSEGAPIHFKNIRLTPIE